ncbi:unnamed protein product [Tilletia controversa]|uniref:Uncharacterized protein n=3 Tax=Tilletia TaxID=13289 RepID=A0A8X7MRT8_9BASI|nr:hypothetical protein CF328_g4245 [Tilletia controversa]KAE8196605.1 hypothetical protein CF336_g2541 [Tilletia laevis]KAE8259843.1 hypothetical protein A4X03_0g3972 [Tilletia caries]KAE8201193.1 hypothetical protein CF335_g3797 [Tilletia laevis]KAE8246527.1 hypothetical protein A4X06_0g4978 [Tilletia controversa]
MKLSTVVAVALTVAVVDGVSDAVKKKKAKAQREKEREREREHRVREREREREYEYQRAQQAAQRRRRASGSAASGTGGMPYYDQAVVQRRSTGTSTQHRPRSGDSTSSGDSYRSSSGQERR